ncbi:hypothetical protein GCM10023188_32230 [Pontibacter saemangeumensis]|uniref:SIR2-like domain-containing protein n=1 Tax=Pontibacter saemangeumensis TaxID=1084525 RepID=A0ABP8LWV5_9BACT
MTREEEITKVYGGKPHVVILGAGASIASTRRNPEATGKELPSMYNITDVVGLRDIVDALPDGVYHDNFEILYSKLYDLNPLSSEIIEINKRIYDYFSGMKLPVEPTIYDYLVLSLRAKDTIATFNWDPFLHQAWSRNQPFFTEGRSLRECDNLYQFPPKILFLHGCVSIGYDATHDASGPSKYNAYTANGDLCYFEPIKLLYPVTHKDYNVDPYIKSQWIRLQRDLKEAKRVTVFGYSAPQTDVEAIDLLKEAWGEVDARAYEQFELIDIRKEDDVKESWNEFIHSHHYDYHKSFFDCSLANHLDELLKVIIIGVFL